MKKLNLGCGIDYKEGWINLDENKLVKADIYHDLDKFPYPFEDNTFQEIYANMILEHLDKPIDVLKEIIRISKDKAELTVIVPHADSYANKTGIQHTTNFTENSFVPELLKEYGFENLELKKQEFIFHNNWRKNIPFKKYLKIFFNGIYDDLEFLFEVNK